MSNLSQFLGGGGGGLTPKFQEFNSSGTFTPSQALIDAGGYIEVFLVGGGSGLFSSNTGAAGGEVITKKMYLTSTSGVLVTIGAGGSSADGGNSSFNGGSAGGVNITALGGSASGKQLNRLGAGWGGNIRNTGYGSAGSGTIGYGAGGAVDNAEDTQGVHQAKANSGQGSSGAYAGGSGYCLVKWYE